jgi:hypothetical protein
MIRGCLCVDRGHLRSKSVRELRKFAAWAQRETGANKRADAAIKTRPASHQQNCTPQTLQPVRRLGNPEKAGSGSDETADQDNLGGALALLEILAQRNRSSVKSNGDVTPAADEGEAR